MSANTDANTGSVYLFQYVLDDNAQIVKDELYDYFILRTLFEHAKESSLSKEDIKKKIELDYHLEKLPPIHFESAFKRVIKKKKIIGTEKFTLSSDIKIEINQNIQNYIDLTNSIQNELKDQITQNIPDISSDDSITLSKNFFKLLGKTFSIHGKDVARVIINQNGGIEKLEEHDGFKDDYKNLILNMMDSKYHSKIDSILNDFLFNSSDSQSKFIFKMIQGHTLLEILNVDPELLHIQEEALKETKVYLDTNVVINLLFKNSRHYKSINSILEQSQQLGVKFIVNDITKIEFEKWLESHKNQVEPIRKSPKAFTDVLFNKKIDAPLLMEYLDSLRTNPRQTIDQFCIGFEDITINLKTNHDIEYENDDTMHYEKIKEYSKLTRSVHLSNESKSPPTVKHDVSCILKVKELRKEIPSGPLGPKIWFLTTDSTLWRSERKIYPKKDIRASLTPYVWMQIMSPLISPKLQSPHIMNAFSKLVSTNFGMDSVIKQEDVLNISAAFIDDKGLSSEDFDGLLGDKHVRNTLKKLHTAQVNDDELEKEKWTREGLSAISKNMKNKNQKEIEKALRGMNQKLTAQEKNLKKQDKKIVNLEDTLEKKWKKNYITLLFIAIGITIVIPIILSYSNLGLTSDNLLGIVGIEITCILGIFVPWKLKHK